MGIFNLEDRMREATGKGPTDPVWEPQPPEPKKPVWRTRTIVLIIAVLGAILIVGIAFAQTNVAPGTTVSTTGPVTASTKIDVGSLASSVFAYAMTAALGVVVPFIVKALLSFTGQRSEETTDILRARFTQFVTNGANFLIAFGAERLRGLSPIEVKGAILPDLVRYVQAHGACTVKKLGVDPEGPKLVEAVKAQLETAIANPAVPTAAALSPHPAQPEVTQ